MLDTWYSRQDLKVLLNRELNITARSQGTTQHNLECCCRGIELQLAGEDKATKIYNYIKTVLRAEDEIRKKNKNGFIDADEFLMISQILTKEDRTKAVKMGFKDASEVQKMLLNDRVGANERMERSASPQLAAAIPSPMMASKPIISISA